MVFVDSGMDIMDDWVDIIYGGIDSESVFRKSYYSIGMVIDYSFTCTTDGTGVIRQ